MLNSFDLKKSLLDFLQITGCSYNLGLKERLHDTYSRIQTENLCVNTGSSELRFSILLTNEVLLAEVFMSHVCLYVLFFMCLKLDHVILCVFDSIFVDIQGSYRSWKTWKVMESYNFIFQAWKVMEFRFGSWKVMENQYAFYE